MRKILISVLSVVCILCLALSVGCAATYYKLIFEQSAGVTYDCEVKSGAQVKKGYTVTFGIVLDEQYADCDYTVYKDSDVLTANDDGTFSFKMTADTTISVTIDSDMYTVTFATSVDEDLGFVKFFDEDGSLLTSLTATNNLEVAFTLQVSVYYLSTYEVQVNDEILNDGDDGAEDGIYHFTVTEDVEVSLYGLELDDQNFTVRSDGGSGTESDPYMISRPIDLYMMAALINSGSYVSSGYYIANYKLANDIDMEGERLYVIADYVNSSAVFCGTFDGNGHTISNYTISAYKYDEDNSVNVFVEYIGLFGYCSASIYGNAEIYNLTLDNYTITVDESAQGMEELFFVGGIVGAGLGLDITGCRVTNGNINVICATSSAGTSVLGPFGYIGGIAGYLQSGYSTDGTAYYAFVSSCYSESDINVSVGYAQAAGGIVGILVSAARQANAFVINCYATGVIYGASRTGGIVGHLGAYSSVQNCYFTGVSSAKNDVSVGVSADYEYYRCAYAGGLVGYAENDTAVTDSFFDSNAGSLSVSASGGINYQAYGAFVGGIADSGTTEISTAACVVYNCYTAFDKEGLGWDEADWTFGSGYPTINYSSTSKSFTVTVNYSGGITVNGNSYTEQVISDGYLPMSYCFLIYGGLPEYADADNGYRSYAYYFDEALTQRVPYGYVPMDDITLYLVFADYSEVVGQYYFTIGNSATYLTLNADGSAEFRYGALSYTSDYFYDGSAVYVLETRIGALSPLVNSGTAYADDGGYYTYKCVLSDGVLTVSDINFFIEGGTGAITAVVYDSSFGYGSYYYIDSDGTAHLYVFEKNGTGTYDGVSMIYKIGDGTVTVTVGTREYSATVTDGKVTAVNGTAVEKCDDFLGSWESQATLNIVYEFDGMGGYTRTEYSYVTDSDSNVKYTELASESGRYSVTDNRLTILDGSGTETDVKFTLADGYIATNDGTQNYAYYVEGSYTGNWYFANGKEPVSLTLDGITSEGYGTASVTYSGVTLYTLTYEKSSDGTLLFYYGDYEFGSLEYDKTVNALTGSMYSVNSGTVRTNVTFFLYDEYLGYWISDSSDFYLVYFNGFGAYSVKSTSNYIATSGRLVIYTSADDVGTSVTYKLNDATMTGTFTYNGVSYTISYDTSSGTVSIVRTSDSENIVSLSRRDGWYGLELTDAGGNVYSFDGRGALSDSDNKGVITVTASDGTAATGSYRVTDGGISYTLNGTEYTIDTSSGGFVSGDTALSVNVPFTGSWYVSGQTDKNGDTDTIEIGEIGSSLTAAGTFLGTDVTYTYHPDGQYLSFVYEGTTMYVNYVQSGGVSELYVSSVNSILSTYTVCVAELDSYAGVYYMNGDEDGYCIVFDGLGKSFLGAGTAYIYYRNGSMLINSHTYSVADDGTLTLDSGTYLFTDKNVSDRNVYENLSFEMNDKDYIIAYVDIMYGREMAAEDGKYFVFDGLGTAKVYASEGSTEYTEYAYEYEASNSDSSFYQTLVYIYDEDGSVCRIAYPFRTTVYQTIIYIDDLYYVSATDSDGYTYTFNGDSVKELFADSIEKGTYGNGTLTADSSTSVTESFTYKITEIDSENDWYYVTIVIKGVEYDAVVKGGDTNSLEFI